MSKKDRCSACGGTGYDTQGAFCVCKKGQELMLEGESINAGTVSEARIYQYLLGYIGSTKHSFKAYLGHAIKLNDPGAAAREIGRFLDRKMQDAQAKE